MKTILSKPNYTAQLGLNGTDLSHMVRFSSPVGALIPVMADELYPNDHIKISVPRLETLSILKMQSGSFARATVHLDIFFVPFSQLFCGFDSFIYGVQDFKSTFMISDVPDGDPSPYSGRLPGIRCANLQEVLWSWENDSAAKDLMGEKKINNAYRLMQALGYGVPSIGTTPTWVGIINPFRLCAYQKIYSDYYRLTDWEENDVFSYNVDRFIAYADGSSQGPDIPNSCIEKMLTMRYRPWSKDYFTNIFPEPLFGPESINAVGTFDTSAIKQFLSVNGRELMITDANGDETTPYSQALNAGNGLFSAPDVRTAFAVQKLLEKTRRAPKHYDKQTAAHFGIDVPKQLDSEVYFLGDFTQDLSILDVVSTAQTDDKALGQVGGRGYAVGMHNKPIDFTANCHGVLMAIFSIEPYSDYQSLGIDKQNTYLNRFDYFIPELDNLGQVPQYRARARWIPQSASANSEILGWEYSFAESKIKYDRVFGSLQYSANSWAPVRNNEAVEDYQSLRKFYISPSYYDPMFEVKYLATDRPNRQFATDPFVTDVHFDYKKLSTMSRYSLLNL